MPQKSRLLGLKCQTVGREGRATCLSNARLSYLNLGLMSPALLLQLNKAFESENSSFTFHLTRQNKYILKKDQPGKCPKQILDFYAT
jgi:hypothetical protein